MIPRVAWFLTKLVVVSLSLTWLWIEWGRRAYGRLFLEIANPIYGWFGVTAYQGGVRERYINYIPFLVLMILTPHISWKRRSVGIFGGMVLIFVFQLGFNIWVESAYPVQSSERGGGFEVYFPAILLADALPLILWATICHEFVGGVISRAFDSWGVNRSG